MHAQGSPLVVRISGRAVRDAASPDQLSTMINTRKANTHAVSTTWMAVANRCAFALDMNRTMPSGFLEPSGEGVQRSDGLLAVRTAAARVARCRFATSSFATAAVGA